MQITIHKKIQFPIGKRNSIIKRKDIGIAVINKTSSQMTLSFVKSALLWYKKKNILIMLQSMET